MGSDTATGEDPALPEDTLDLGERLDPVRTLLRRTAAGDRDAASALVDVLGPRIHGLAVHVTGSSARAGRLTVWVLRTCVRDAAQLASGGLPGEAAVLDRARRAAVATRPSGDVRSLVAPDTVTDRTRDRREVDVVRALLALPPVQRALVESAAQGRFPYSGPQRPEPAAVLAGMLDELVPFGGPESPQLRGLAALDALALAEEGERARLRELTAGSEAAAVHRHAIEAAARLTLLTALPPSRDLHTEVLDALDSIPPARSRGPARPASAARPPAGPEAAYHGTYATPVLGTDTQRRVVGPPAMTGGPQAGPAAAAATAPAEPSDAPRAASARPGATRAPAFSFRPSDEAGRTRRQRRRPLRAARPGRGAPWPARAGPSSTPSTWLWGTAAAPTPIGGRPIPPSPTPPDGSYHPPARAPAQGRQTRKERPPWRSSAPTSSLRLSRSSPSSSSPSS